MNVVTDEEAMQALAAYEAASRNYAEASRVTGIARSTLQHRVSIAKRRQMETAPPQPAGSRAEAASRPFSVPPLPSPDEPLEALLERRRATARRVIQAHDARELIPVNLTIKGPVGLWLMGDPHLDNDGCDFVRLEEDLRLVAHQPRVISINAGDVVDNWIGRLERLSAAASTKASDGWRLAEWLFGYEGIDWLGFVGGNHDAWSGHRDPLKWIVKGKVPLYEADVLRIALHHPGGAVTRVHGRHNFKGQSQWNDMHGLKKESMIGWRDHLLFAGHLHLGEDGGFINPDGFVTQMVRLSGYKRADTYAVTGQFKSKPLHPSALVIINPDRPDADRGRVWVAPDVETGIDYLNFISRRA